MKRQPKPGEIWKYKNITSELYGLVVVIIGEPFLPFGCTKENDELRVKLLIVGWNDNRSWPYWLNKIEREYVKNLEPME